MHLNRAKALNQPSPQQSVIISCNYMGNTSTTIQLPLYKTWDDVEEWYVKWNTLHYRLKGEDKWCEQILDHELSNGDMKTPDSTTIFSEDYNEEFASR